MFLVTAVTGIYLMFYYRPIAEYAYADMKYLEFDMPFGMLMRNMHRWAAHAMVDLVWLHMFRVFLTGSYKPPREFNWIVGVLLLVLTLLLELHRLPVAVGPAVDLGRHRRLQHGAAPRRCWVTKGRSPIFVGANPIYDARAFLFGGGEIGPHTLLRFYILHCIFIPLVASILMAVHFWRIRRDGFSGPSLLVCNTETGNSQWQKPLAKEYFRSTIRFTPGRTWCAWSFWSRFSSSWF